MEVSENALVFDRRRLIAVRCVAARLGGRNGVVTNQQQRGDEVSDRDSSGCHLGWRAADSLVLRIELWCAREQDCSSRMTVKKSALKEMAVCLWTAPKVSTFGALMGPLAADSAPRLTLVSCNLPPLF